MSNILDTLYNVETPQEVEALKIYELIKEAKSQNLPHVTITGKLHSTNITILERKGYGITDGVIYNSLWEKKCSEYDHNTTVIRWGKDK